LVRDAALLAEMRLLKAADLVKEAAANAPEAGSECPYPDGTANARDWHRRHKQDFTDFYQDDEDRKPSRG
jgi:hypothetical protein